MRSRAKLARNVESDPVIFHGQAQHFAVIRKGNPDPMRLRVLADVRESLLEKPIQVNADTIRYSRKGRTSILNR